MYDKSDGYQTVVVGPHRMPLLYLEALPHHLYRCTSVRVANDVLLAE